MKHFIWWGIAGIAIGVVFWNQIVQLNIPLLSTTLNSANTMGAGGNSSGA